MASPDRLRNNRAAELHPTEVKSVHNQEQIEFWNGPGGSKWVAHNGMMEALLHDIGFIAINAAAPQAGEKALDIGCGCGNQTLDLARVIGTEGEVIGVDVSGPMLQLANRLYVKASAHESMARVGFVQADAAEHEFVDRHFDLLYSRFGVMFFDQPEAAFVNLRSALKPGGRLAFVCWQAAELNPFMSVPMRAALQHLPAPPPMPPGAPGPFAFADAGYLASILETAGFDQIRIDPVERPLHFGKGHSLEAACAELIEIGPISRLLLEADEATRAHAEDAVRETLASYYTPETGLNFAGAFWLVTAINPTGSAA